MRFRSLCPLFLLATVSVVQAHAQSAYKPEVGDYVEVFRRTFSAANYRKGRSELLKVLKDRNSRDGLVRLSILAENRSTHEIVTVVFSDPYNRGQWKFKGVLDYLKKWESKSPQRHEFKLFEINDEGVKIKVGDTMKLYGHKVKSDKHDHMRNALATRMLKALQKDNYKANGYFAESETQGQLLGIGIGEFSSAVGVIGKSVAHMNAHRTSPVKRDTLRVILVSSDKRK